MLASCALLFALGALFPAKAQQYPSQALRIIVTFPPGAGADGQTMVVENVTGASGTIGTARAAQAAPDGYALLVGTPSTHGTNVAVYPKLSYDPVRYFAPIWLIGSSPFLLIATRSLNASSVWDLLPLARAEPGELNYASYGNGTVNHLVAELFSSMWRASSTIAKPRAAIEVIAVATSARSMSSMETAGVHCRAGPRARWWRLSTTFEM